MEEKGTKKPGKKGIFGVVLAVILIGALAVMYALFGEKPVAGAKDVTIEVINSAGQSTVYELNTDAEFLQQAMDEAEGLTYGGTNGAYGLMIEIVNGETAIYAQNNAYWCFNVNGEYSNYGIGTQPVNDGDAFQIIYTKAN